MSPIKLHAINGAKTKIHRDSVETSQRFRRDFTETSERLLEVETAQINSHRAQVQPNLLLSRLRMAKRAAYIGSTCGMARRPQSSIASQGARRLSKPLDYERWLTATARARKPSPIRALQPFVNLPGMISLGGGMPNASTFPFESMDVKLKDGTRLSVPLSEALQYSPTRGLPKLVNLLSDMQKAEHQPPPLPSGQDREIIVTTGSQDALSKAFEMFLGPSESLLVENPTYSGSLSALGPLGCRLVSVETDGQGMKPQSLEGILKAWNVISHGPRPRVLYTIPTGGNPTGRSLTTERKKEIYEIASRPENNLIILEDDPYYYLRLNQTEENAAEDFCSFLSLDVDGRVLRFDSFSKILSSGLRLGFATGPGPLIERIELHQQSSELHTSGLSQAVALSLLTAWQENEGWQKHLQSVQAFYKRKRDVFIKSAERHLQGLAEWHEPDAGMFVWMKLLNVKDSDELVTKRAREAKVLLVPGSVFVPDGCPSPYVRASYSSASDEDIDQALERLGNLLRER